ncbi:collagenase [Streptomyces collinus]|uniref:microbial collagenase n=1 Tax=Streptomyces collinus (strain DSM 40733 / Tue 365) TaxID=1214242 RepID=S5VGM2_STRC3|nr:collagenase [Streptomyces collinus]AGS67605.1 microbial collagenase [Streptomyces collinus Tu 365]UJA06287.1 collagenase [Streptomyces collinus]UJA12543.1 collagenase [Streptomyces collinus]
MRYRFGLPGRMAGAAAVCVTVAGLLSTPALASPQQHLGTTVRTAGRHAPAPPPAGPATGASERPAAPARRLSPAQLPPRAPASTRSSESAPRGAAKAASCTPADFGGRTGSALVAFVRASTPDCVNTLFTVTGRDAHDVFRQAQMVTVANAFTSTARKYRGDNSGSLEQLVLFLRAGYYVQFNHAADVGAYTSRLTSAVTAGLDTFFARSHTRDVSAANGDILGEAVVLTDSADQQGRYLYVYRRLLDGYDSSYDAVDSMIRAVNDVYTPLWRGNWNPEYVRAVAADPRVIDTLYDFALANTDLLGTGLAFLDSNAGMNVARYLEHPELRDTAQPLTKGLLDATAMTGPTAGLWVAVATQANYYDAANCSSYGVCDLPGKLTEAVLPTVHRCDANITVRAQALTAADLDAACAGVLGQDAYFRSLVKAAGPVPGQYVSTLRLVVFASRADYQTYAGAIFGISTDNGGMTLEGDPSDPANQATSIMYQKDYDDGFTARIWNLNHEYTHFLDGRDDMRGDFGRQISVPDVWWIEGVAEYVSYGYRGLADDQAVQEAGKHTYRLSTLFENTYDNSDVTRTYPWGYLAVRYMAERHPDDVQRMLARFRAGDYTGGYAVYHDGIGTRYDADFDQWLTACASGACARPAKA